MFLPRSNSQIFYLSLAFSFLALGGAFFVQRLGYQPCILCIYQRIPYAFIFILSILGLIFKSRKVSYIILTCIIIAFICEIGLASYHVLVEHHIIEETTSCSGSLNLPDDPKEALKQLMNKPATSCAKPEIILLSLSMAEWNLFFALIITIIIYLSRK